MSCEAVARNLDPYVDRELDANLAEAVHDHVRECVMCRRRVAEREALVRLVRSAPYYAAPDSLRSKVRTQGARTVTTRRLLGLAAAAVLFLSLGGAITVLLRTSPRSVDPVVEAVVDAHVRSLMADHLFDVQSTDQHTVKPWFLGKLDFSPPVVDLSAMGYPLVGGRIEYIGGQPAAALVYERRRHTINVIVASQRDGKPAPGNVLSVRGFNVQQWSRGGMSFWAVSDLNATELAEFARALQNQ